MNFSGCRLPLWFLTIFVFTGCGLPTPAQDGGRTPGAVHSDTSIDRAMGEELEFNEDVAIQAVITAAQKALVRDFRAPNVPRDAHAKSHGCLKASFEVDPSSLPTNLRHGVFAEKRQFPAWVRFSNNTSDPMSKDKDLDLRGIAIKLMGVQGEKILSKEAHALTQDFLMFASPIFFVKDIRDYAEFVDALGRGKAVQDLLHRPRSLVQLATAQLRAASKRNPLKLHYFSAAPFRLGSPTSAYRAPVKYGLVACEPAVAAAASQGNKKRPNFMREALKKSLQEKAACFQFQVQVGDTKDPVTYPVEDPTVLWSEARSPYLTVARLKIPQQDFDTPALDAFCERLSFTPWHALPEHRPLGRTNRMRRKLYEAISSYRHHANGVENREPTTLNPETAF